MKILSCNPGHDGAIVYLEDGRLIFSREAEKDSNSRYAAISEDHIVGALDGLEQEPDVFCIGGYWLNESILTRTYPHVFYRGLDAKSIAVGQRTIAGRSLRYFSSSHERSHLLCAYGLSGLPKGTPCYVLVWEGIIGSFYEIDADFNITRLAEPMTQPGNRYAAIYGLADPSFPKDSIMARATDAGKLMALASFATRSVATAEEERLLDFLLTSRTVRLDRYDGLEQAPHYNVGTDDAEFRNFAGIASDRIFDVFHRYAETSMRKGLPLLIVGGCGLNCDWNSKWEQSGLFPEIFVPPVANDSGSAIGTAIDAQFRFTGDPTIGWDVYSGDEFRADMPFDRDPFDIVDADPAIIADMLAGGLILGWVNGRYEIGPNALCNRSILAAPFDESTRVRLNVIKQREQFRPIAPVCLEDEALRWFGCARPSPYMLYTFQATTDALAAVTHVNGSARIQTVSATSNRKMFELLGAFRARTGYGVLCNTSLNFIGKGFINTIADLARYTVDRKLDGFVVDGRAYLRKDSEQYLAYLHLVGADTGG
jgi:predicted NodU family carbamoyl transferase